MQYKEEDWYKIRENYITASEAAVLVGLHPYSSPGKLKKEKFKGNAYTIIGQVLESVVVDITNRVLGETFKLYDNGISKTFFIKGKLGATPDACNGAQLLECKSTNPDTFLKYRDNMPLHYLTQLQTQLWCCGMTEGYLAILSTNLTQTSQQISWPIIIYKVLRCDEFCDILSSEAQRFFESEGTYRVNSQNKKLCFSLLEDTYEKIFEPQIQKMSLQEFMRS